jgi:phospholipid transport system substrate-binding protein
MMIVQVRRHSTLSALAALVTFTLTLAPAARAVDEVVEAGPTRVVGHFNDTMLAVLKDATTLGYKGRLDRLCPVVLATFDLDFMAEKAIGRYWRTLADKERERWRSTFAAFMCANYAGRLDEFTGQQFEMIGSQPAPSDTVVVQTRVIDPADENVDLTYRMRSTTAGWRVIDIYLNGTVSELALRRADYSAVLKKDGFDALLTSVRQKIADLEAGKGA